SRRSTVLPARAYPFLIAAAAAASLAPVYSRARLAPPAVTAGTQPIAVLAADLNRDGKPDLAVANRADGTISVVLGNGDGTFQAQKTFPVGNLPLAEAV